jgi:hypothetical protein
MARTLSTAKLIRTRLFNSFSKMSTCRRSKISAQGAMDSEKLWGDMPMASARSKMTVPEFAPGSICDVM